MNPAVIMATGAISGGVNSAIEGGNNRAALREYIKQQEAIQGQINANTTQRTNDVNTAYAGQLAGMDQNVQDYYNALKNADYSQFNVSAPEDYKGRDLNELTQQMMNPQTDTMVQTASNKVQGAAANTGGLFSGITAKNIANATAQVQAEQWDKARSAAQTQQAQDYQQYQDKFANLLAANQVNKSNLTDTLGAKGALHAAQTSAFQASRGELGNIQDQADQRSYETQNALATARGQKAGVGSMWSNFAQGALSGLSKAL